MVFPVREKERLVELRFTRQVDRTVRDTSVSHGTQHEYCGFCTTIIPKGLSTRGSNDADDHDDDEVTIQISFTFS